MLWQPGAGKSHPGTFLLETCAPGSSACPNCVRDVRPGAHGRGRGNRRRTFCIPRISLPALELYIYRVQLRTSRARARARARARTPPGGRAHAARQSDPAEDRVSREIAFFQGPPSILSGFRAFSLPAGIVLTPPTAIPRRFRYLPEGAVLGRIAVAAGAEKTGNLVDASNAPGTWSRVSDTVRARRWTRRARLAWKSAGIHFPAAAPRVLCAPARRRRPASPRGEGSPPLDSFGSPLMFPRIPLDSQWVAWILHMEPPLIPMHRQVGGGGAPAAANVRGVEGERPSARQCKGGGGGAPPTPPRTATIALRSPRAARASLWGRTP